jgi:outer membrane lipoprotein-sorting protein
VRKEKAMSEDFVRSELKEHLQQNMPSSQDPWPQIREKIQGSKTVRRSWIGSGLRPITVIAGVAVVLVLALAGALLWPAQPKLVNAEAIVAQAEKVAKDSSSSGLRSGYAVEHWRYNEVDSDLKLKDSLMEGRTETWYQAPDKLITKSRYHSESDGSFEATYLEIGDTLYQTLGSLPQVNITMRRPESPRTFRALDTEQLYSSPGMGPVDKPYTVTLVGEEQILGRAAYVLEWNATPEVLAAEKRGGFSLLRHKYRKWIDQQFYLVLKEQAWNRDGDWIDDRVIETLELNKPVDSALFEVTPAAGYVVADMRPADDKDVAQGWREASRQVGVTLYEPGESALAYGAELRKPYYVASQGVVSQALVRPTSRGRYFLDVAVVQGPPSAIDESQLGSSTPTQVGSRQGRLYEWKEAHQLVFDIDGTRIMVYSSNAGAPGEVEGRLVSIGESLVPVGKK